jgi:hypothetical protein
MLSQMPQSFTAPFTARFTAPFTARFTAPFTSSGRSALVQAPP